MDIKKKIKRVLLSDLKPYAKNAKLHNNSQVDIINKSLSEYDYVEPIIVGTGNVIIGGHCRFLALKKKNPKQKIEVVDVSYLPAKKQKKLRILLNKSSSQDYDNDLLQAEIESLYDNVQDNIDKINADLAIDGEDLSKILGVQDTEGDDDIPKKVKSITKTGDLWQLGRHRLLCGDSTKAHDVDKLMNGKKADMVFTDPPYNVAYGSSKNPIWGSKWNGNSKDGVIKNDKMEDGSWCSFCHDIADILKSIAVGPIYACHAPGPDGMRMTLTFVDTGLHWSSTIILYKDRLVPGRSDYQKRYECCFYGWVEGVKINHLKDRTRVDVWEYKRPSINIVHPTMKPVEIILNAISHHPTIRIVVDIFLGSGSTLIACEKTNRICYGMELDEHYTDVIVKRYRNFCKDNGIKTTIKRNGKVFYVSK